MSTPLIVTATMSAVRELARRALALPDGLDIAFTVERYGDPEVCASLAKGFSNAFSSMRARARRRDQVTAGQPVTAFLSAIRGPFDDLGCQNLPDGKGGRIIKLRKSASIMFDLDVTSGGKPLEDFDPNTKMLSECLDLLWREEQRAKLHGNVKDPLSDEARDWFWNFSPYKENAQASYEFYHIPLPAFVGAGKDGGYAPNSAEDPANCSLEDMP